MGVIETGQWSLDEINGSVDHLKRERELGYGRTWYKHQRKINTIYRGADEAVNQWNRSSCHADATRKEPLFPDDT